ncbi:hypothetical protein ACFUC1_20095, partial [Pedococcus sp. NPDC057267]|uniref:hypothetical protein n=1 Tax=Pedococcus sp. NPDC057267 TaxID=3346077 RepID=UPI00362A65C4
MRHRDGDERAAEHLEGAPEAGEVGRAAGLLRQQGADGRTRGDADADEHLGADERADGAPLDGVEVGGRGHGFGHRDSMPVGPDSGRTSGRARDLARGPATAWPHCSPLSDPAGVTEALGT